jgi:hypothetical protein
MADLGQGISSRSHFEAGFKRPLSSASGLFVLFYLREGPSDADASTDSRDVNRLDSRRGRDPALYDLQP